jgi:glycosyltransferase involved in cell wall biosynthesis
MPKVLQIHNRLIVGGPSIIVTALTKYLSPEFETLMVVGEKEDHEQSAAYMAEEMGINYVTIPQMGRSINPLNDYQAYRKLKAVIKDFQPDIVHTHAAKPGALGRLAASAMNVPAIVHTYHGHVFHSYFNNVKSNIYINTERFLARKSTAIVAISETQKKELVEEFKIAPVEKFRVIPLGLDLEKFHEDQPQKRKLFREEFGLNEEDVAIGIVGRLVPVKNHSLFLKAIAHVLTNTSKKIKAFIVGDGETRNALEIMAGQLNIQFSTEIDKTHTYPLIFTSWRSDVDVINAGLDIVTLTSLNEGTPVSLIEAQAANKPIVSTRVGGISDIVIEGKTALLANVDDHAGFCQHLQRLVEDDNLRVELGSNSSYFVTRRFSYQRMVEDTAELYLQLLGKKVPANPVLR